MKPSAGASIWLNSALYCLIGIVLFPLVFQVFGATLKVLFYRGLLYAGIAFAIQFAIVSVLVGRAALLAAETRAMVNLFSFAICALSLSFNLTFLIVFPVTFDRSVTTFLLETLDERGPMTPGELEQGLVQGYIVRQKAVERRLKEQEITGTIRLAGGKVELLEPGKRLLRFSRLIRLLYGVSDPSLSR